MLIPLIGGVKCRPRTTGGIWHLSDLLWPSRAGKQGTREMKILLVAPYCPRRRPRHGDIVP